MYIDAKTKFTITCKIHGDFEQTPDNHIHGHGCYECGLTKISENISLSFEEFLQRAYITHGSKYTYIESSYVNVSTKLNIICKRHGEFRQTPSDHTSGRGCKKCGLEASAEKQRIGFDAFLKKAKEVHGDAYNYSSIKNYVNTNSKNIITCKIHGPFEQNLHSHLSGVGCPKCSKTGIDLAAPTTFYVLEIAPTDDSILGSGCWFIGYGISNNFNSRLSNYKGLLKMTGYVIIDIMLYEFESGFKAKSFENKVKSFKAAHVRIPIVGFRKEALYYKYKQSFLKFLNKHIGKFKVNS